MPSTIMTGGVDVVCGQSDSARTGRLMAKTATAAAGLGDCFRQIHRQMRTVGEADDEDFARVDLEIGILLGDKGAE